MGSKRCAILSYASGASGWSDDLTAFHEDTAGSHHPIDEASRAHALEELGRLPSNGGVVLEVGSSSGFILRLIRERFSELSVIGSDYVRGPLEALAAQVPDLPLLQFDLCECPLPSNSVDAVLLLNVLEHIKDDDRAIQQVYRILRPNGLAIIEVPAGPELYDIYDELLMHQRRYKLPALKRQLRAAGFEVVQASHLGALLFPAFLIVKQRNKRYLAREEAAKRAIVAQNIRATGYQTLAAALRLEQGLGRWLTWPFGIRCLATARKPD